ncbi:MAG: hypothetical protein KJ072_17270 [Verrucomicrobia bacterium]|nr:hypothetical protein [Verrucomicrobiota bacterium]
MNSQFPALMAVALMTMSPIFGASRDAQWKEVDQARDQGLPQTAIDKLKPIEQAALNERAWGEAARAIALRLTFEGQIQGNKPEEKILRMRAELERAPAELAPMLQTIQAHWYWQYFQQNRWRFMRRTMTEEPPGADFTTWDLPRLFAEIDRQFQGALAHADALKRMPVSTFDGLLVKGTLPDRYRPTLYDFIAQEALSFYTAGEQAAPRPVELFTVRAADPIFDPVDRFLEWRPEAGAETNTPAVRAIELYQELLRFHRGDAEPTAFLDVELARLVHGYNVAVGEAKEARYFGALKAFIDQWADHELAAMALHRWAAVLHQKGDWAGAHALAVRGMEIHGNSVGGRQCHNLRLMIEARRSAIETEWVWNAPFPTIDVQYRNLTNVWFRAVRVEWADFLDRRRNRPERLNERERKELLARKADLAWSVALPPTTDFKERTERIAAPENLPAGFYFLIASHRADFGEQDNTVHFTDFWVSKLALILRPTAGAIEGFVLEAASGEPVEGAEVAAWFLDPQRNRVPAEPLITDEQGQFRFSAGQGQGYVIRVRHQGEELASQSDVAAHLDPGQPNYQWSAIFLDRALYRPGQTIQYKGISLEVNQEANNYRVLAGQRLTVVFNDVNGQEIARAQHQCNDYGSFSGSFTAPRDRLPGAMSLQVIDGPKGSAMVRVEEYKRPKFQVTLAAPASAPRLNDGVIVPGKAESYTGAPVDGAEVSYRVVREVQWPVWRRGWFGWPPGRVQPSQEIAQGKVQTDAAGNFKVEFVAQADPAAAAEDEPVFRFTVHADVTDTAGETRSDQRTIQVGYTALKANLEADDWQTSGKPVVLKVSTRTLDDEPAVAEGVVKVFKLKAPAKVHRRPLRQEHTPWVYSEGSDASDGSNGSDASDLSDPANWELGEQVAEKGFTTSAEGVTEMKWSLPVGAYRAMLETQDRFGKRATAQLRLEVLDPRASRLGIRVANLLKAPSWTLEPGQTLEAVWGTGYEAGRAFVEIEHRGRILRRFWTEPGRTQSRIEQAVTEEMRGGFQLHVTHVKENRAYFEMRRIEVPWSNRELALEWERLTSKLGPSQQETWTAIVKRPGGERAVAEMVATLYDASLDQFAAHDWPRQIGSFYVDQTQRHALFQNTSKVLQRLQGNWQLKFSDASMSYRSFPPELGISGGVELTGLMRSRYGLVSRSSMPARGGVPMAAPAMAEMAMSDAASPMMVKAVGFVDASSEMAAGGGGEPASASVKLDQVTARQNLNETAFFFPQLLSDSNGVVRMTFTMPEALTTWRFMGLAHDRELRSGFLEGKTVTAKDLMVQPNPPRFVREGDEIEFTVKIQNQSAARQSGRVRLTFNDAASTQPVDALLGNTRPELRFSIPAKESRSYAWRIKVSDGLGFLTYKVVAATRGLSDGEEGYLPVLSRRVLVTESLPLPIRGPATKQFRFAKLVESGGSDTLEHQNLVVQMVSNPAWYAVLALPYLMEFPHECTEQTFNRLYANALARHIANSDPRIRRIFEQWKNTEALDSPLEKNAELKALALEETPWVRQAAKESQARRNVGVLFDENRLNYETERLLRKLAEQQLGDGAWPWFPGGRPNDYMTLYMVTGFGRLRHLGVDLEVSPAIRALERLDQWTVERYQRIQKQEKPEDYVPSPTDALFLYGRSFFLKDRPVGGDVEAAMDFFLGQARKHWLKTGNRQSQGHLALALKRFNAVRGASDTTPADILRSLKERAVRSEEMGMFWRDTEYAWWWYRAPIETQALMIEAFDEVADDAEAVEDCRVWLLKQKQTQDWKTTKATADAVYALLLRGTDALASEVLVEVRAGDRDLTPRSAVGGVRAPGAEAGTGFYEHRFERSEIQPALGEITVKKLDAGVAWGGMHWQYLEDIAKVTPHEGTPLKLNKRLFTKVNTDRGPVLQPVTGSVAVGDQLVVRIELRVDRDMEYVHLKDQRGSGTEPLNVLSGYRYQDGLGYYESTRDTASHFFIDYLPKGTYVFEYSTRVQLRGRYQTGFAAIQCMYAPEFNSHSESIGIEAR